MNYAYALRIIGALLLSGILSGWPAFAQKKITCPNGEVRTEVNVKELALKYDGSSFSATMNGLSVLGSRVSVEPRSLQQAAAATQQWNELLKGLAEGWNACIVSKKQWTEGLNRIYPRLKDDAADLEKIRQLLLQGQQANETRMRTLLDSYLAKIRRFGEISNRQLLLNRIDALSIQIDASGARFEAGQTRIEERLGLILSKIETLPLATPREVETELGKKLHERVRKAEEAYNKGYQLFRAYRYSDAVYYFERALAVVSLHEFYIGLTRALSMTGAFVRGEAVLEEALELALKERDKSHEAELERLLSYRALSKGEIDNALERCLSAWQIEEKILDHNDLEIALTVSMLGTILFRKGDLEGGLMYIRLALEIEEKSSKADPSDVALLTGNMGSVLFYKGNLRERLVHMKCGLEMEENMDAPDFWSMAMMLNNLGAVYYMVGDFDDALQYLMRGIELDEKVFGVDHPNVATDAHHIGATYFAKRDLRRALAYFQRSLKINENILGREEAQVGWDLIDVGSVYVASGDFIEAVRSFERAVVILDKRYGPDHEYSRRLWHTLERVYALRTLQSR